MTGLVRKATFLCVFGLLSAGVAMAHVPDPNNSDCVNKGILLLNPTAPPCGTKAIVYVVGNTGGVPDAVGEFCVTVRDFNNVEIEGSLVTIDFSLCGDDVELCADQLDPDVVIDCGAKTVSKLTDINGEACFRVQGQSKRGTGDCAGASKDCVKITAGGYDLCSGDAPVFDLSAAARGLNPNDLAEFVNLWLICPGGNALRGNYDCSNQVLTANDLSYFITAWLVLSGSASNCDAKCP